MKSRVEVIRRHIKSVSQAAFFGLILLLLLIFMMIVTGEQETAAIVIKHIWIIILPGAGILFGLLIIANDPRKKKDD